MTLDEMGQVQEYATFGMSPEQNRHLLTWTDGPKFFEHLRQVPGPLRLEDLPGYIDSLGYSPLAVVPSPNILGMQMRHRGMHVGFFVSGRRPAERSSRARTKRSWCCSRRRRRPRS